MKRQNMDMEGLQGLRFAVFSRSRWDLITQNDAWLEPTEMPPENPLVN